MQIRLGNHKVHLIHHDPIIYTVDDFLTDEECQHFIDLALPNLEQSGVTGYKKDSTKRHDRVMKSHRNSMQAWIRPELDEITRSVWGRICNLVQLPKENTEKFQVMRYTKGQTFRAHMDAFHEKEGESEYLEDGGQRVVTAMVYLNDNVVGGEIEFNKLRYYIKPKKGMLLVWHNCLKDTDKPHPESMHTGRTVKAGEKWAFSLWIRRNQVKDRR